MKPSPILTEIHNIRDELARKSGFNVRKFMNFIHEREHETAGHGMKFAPAIQPKTKGK